MDDLRRLKSTENEDQEGSGVTPEEGATEESATEEPMGVPFGSMGATFLTNVLQYAVFLGLTMIVLIIIRIFMPPPMIP